MSDPRWPLLPGYRIELLAESEAVSANDVLALWKREGVLPDEEARRRIDEVLLVATHTDSVLVGVATTYLDYSLRLRMDVWKVRVLVAESHRLSNLSVQLMNQVIETLATRFSSGEDTRASGILLEVENADLMRSRRRGYWRSIGFSFVGIDPAGRHLRLRWFPGALAPSSP